MPLTYAPPSITVQQLGALTPILAGQAPKTILCIGTGPKGPDYPVLISPTQATTLFGDPSTASSVGYSLPYLLYFAGQQRQSSGFSNPVQFLVCRGGVTRASYAVLDGQVGNTTNAVNTITLTAATSGTFTVSFGGQTTAALAYNISTAALQTALTGLSSIGVGNSTVTGTAGISYVCTFAGTMIHLPEANFTVSGAALNAGAGIASAQTTAGAVSGTCFTLQGVGAYAGSAGNALRVGITTAASRVTGIVFTNNATGVVVQQLLDVSNGGAYDLSTNAKIVQAIQSANPLTSINSVVTATLGTSVTVPVVVVAQAFTGGADGKGTPYTDQTFGVSGSGGLLDQSLWTNADYITSGFDGGAHAPVLLAHTTTALAQNQFRKMILGPVAGTLFGTSGLSGTTYLTSGLQTSRLSMMGHDAAYGPHPALGTNYAFDGFYLAAAFAGLKACGGPEQTCVGMSLAGLSSIAMAPDLTAALTVAQQNTLAGVGYLVFEQPYGNAAMTVRDAITAAPYQSPTTGGINPFYQLNVQDIDDTVALNLIRAIQPFKAKPRGSIEEQNGLIQAAAQTGLRLCGAAINGVNTVIVSTDPSTLVTTVAVSYITRYPLLQIVIPTSFSFL